MSELKPLFFDYLSLLKPRVMSLVLFTASIGLLLAPCHLTIWQIFASILYIALGAGAAGALNMWYDADIDALMKRTKTRPIPQGRIAPPQALYFGLILAFIAVVGLGLSTNWFAAFFLAFTIFFYIVIYTILLKRTTPQNIVIGGAAGSFPPMVGYACACGSVSWQSFVLFLLIFLWTPPHFWSLNLFTVMDYEAASIPMLPNVKGENTTKAHILIYSILLSIATIIPYFFLNGCIVYLALAFILDSVLLYLAYRLWLCEPTETTKLAKKLFYFSLLYLLSLFLCILLEIIFKATLGYSI